MEPNEQLPAEAKIFPISAEAINNGLSEIAADPRGTLLEEAHLVETEDPELNNLFRIIEGLPGTDVKTFREGALWTRRLLKTQAKLTGGSVPKLTDSAIDSYVKSQLDRTKSGQTTSDFVKQGMEELKVSEPELFRGLQEITKYRPETTNFNEGALTAYRTVRRMEEGKVLSANLHL